MGCFASSYKEGAFSLSLCCDSSKVALATYDMRTNIKVELYKFCVLYTVISVILATFDGIS